MAQEARLPIADGFRRGLVMQKTLAQTVGTTSLKLFTIYMTDM